MSLDQKILACIAEDPTKLPHYDGITRALGELIGKIDYVDFAQLYVKRGKDAVALIDAEVPAHMQEMRHIEGKNFWMGIATKMLRAQKVFQTRKAAGTLAEPTPEFRARVLESITPKNIVEGRKQFATFEAIVAELEKLAQ